MGTITHPRWFLTISHKIHMEVSFHITTYGHIIDHILCIHIIYIIIIYIIYAIIYTHNNFISYNIVLYIQEVSLAADFSHKQISPDPAAKEQLNLLRRSCWPLGYGGSRQAKPKSNHHFKVYRKLRQWSSLEMEPWHAGTRKTRWKHLSCNAASKTECMSHL